MTVQTNTEQREFQAEVQQVLRLMVHSLYSNKEIFLRELISNASDACDKLRFEAIKDSSLYGEDSELKIDIVVDKDAGTISIRDNGIGMSREEVIDNIGTIASSGTRRFLEALTGDQKKDAQLIGQFGVGFYSAFIVADQVTLTTRRAGSDTGVRWESDGSGTYTIEDAEVASRGTTVTLHLKDDERDLLDGWRVRSLVRRYSDHVAFPIRMEKDVADDDEQEAKAAEWEVVNQASALWTRPKSEISDDDYKSFYKHVAGDFNDPLTWAHNRVEGGAQSYTTLLYLPEKAPFDLMMGREERRGLKLYVRRVFIMDAAEELLPMYLRFVRGVVDSDDLPLNVSRELLQDNRLVSKIKASVAKRVLDMLDDLATDDARYLDFWKQFGQVLKEGLVEDFSNRERLLKLARFASTETNGAEPTVSLAQYVSRMKGAQDKIYYITADNWNAASNSPHLEVFRKKGIEVLLMHDRVDEWVMGHLQEFDGKPFQSIAKGDIDLSNLEDEAEKKERESSEAEAKSLLERMAKVLADKVESVKVSHRLTESPACLVLSEHDMAVHMQALLKQAGHDLGAGSKPRLEINPTHPLIKRLEHESDDERFRNWSLILLDQAWLAEGGQLEDPAGYVRRLNGMLMELG